MQDIITRARDFATMSHAGQFRKDAVPLPYIAHPAEVAQMVQTFDGSETAIAAAWLHDVIEDCGVEAEALREHFGDAVAGVICELSDDKSLPKLKRKWLQVVHAAHMSPDAALVKLCDKMADVRAVGKTPPQHWDLARQLAYIDWAEAVVRRLPAVVDAERMAACINVLDDARSLVGARI